MSFNTWEEKADQSSDRLLEHEELNHGERATHRRRTLLLSIGLTFAAVICVALSFVAGQSMGSRQQIHLLSDGRLAPPGTIKTQWTYNFTFSDAPTPESEAAWNSLPPLGGAFVRHPSDGDIELNVAMYHQLHCLHAVRLAYYYALSQTNETLADMVDGRWDAYGMHSLHHTVHCFDYLRQAIMCAADSNLEVYNAEAHHVDAFGIDKQCRDLSVLDEWAVKWRTSDRAGITRKGQRPMDVAGST